MQSVIRGVKEKGKAYLEALGAEVSVPKEPYPTVTYAEAIDIVSSEGMNLSIGEDLGTVPPEMSHAMDDRAVYSYRVLLFAKRADGSFIAPGEYPRRAIATATTHDLPTLRGYWSGGDIDLRQRLSLYPNEETRQHVADERVRDRHALLGALADTGLKPAAASAAHSLASSIAVLPPILQKIPPSLVGIAPSMTSRYLPLFSLIACRRAAST